MISSSTGVVVAAIGKRPATYLFERHRRLQVGNLDAAAGERLGVFGLRDVEKQRRLAEWQLRAILWRLGSRFALTVALSVAHQWTGSLVAYRAGNF